MAVTIKDVAKAVGVSPSTVSRVLSNKSSISDQTKQKVLSAMKELGYVPNVSAQNLVRGLTDSVGVIFPPMAKDGRIEQQFYMQILSAINSEAKSKGITVAIATGQTNDELIDNVALMYNQRRVDGFILLYSVINDPVKRYLSQNHITYSVVGSPVDQNTAALYIDTDNQLLGSNMVDHLFSKGHQRILFVTDKTSEGFVEQRYTGYFLQMRKLGAIPHEAVLFNRKDPETLDAFYEKLINTKATAVIVIEDILALRVMQYCQLVGYQVPDDISILSINNSAFAEIIHPYLSSYDVSIEDLGRIALNELVKQIRDPDQKRYVKIMVPHRLVTRESVRDLTKINN